MSEFCDCRSGIENNTQKKKRQHYIQKQRASAAQRSETNEARESSPCDEWCCDRVGSAKLVIFLLIITFDGINDG